MNKDKLYEVLKVLLATISILLLIGLIPNTSFQYKHFNVLSGVLRGDSTQQELIDEQYNGIAAEDTALLIAMSDSLEKEARTAQTESLDKERSFGVIDFSKDGNALLQLCQKMKTCRKDNKTVRIGVLGDSFIEADIMTSKLRNLLQAEYGGMGVGFVPVVSPAAEYRKTVKHTFSGWTTHSMVYYKAADWKRFCISGYYFTPSEGAFFNLKTMPDETVTRATFFFINQKKTQLEVSINGEAAKIYEPPTSEDLQHLTFSDNAIKSINVKVKNPDGFTGFGTYLDNSFGVYVDNYSVRGSSGSVLITINRKLSEQFKKDVSYDLLIVQYGLNVLSNKSYTGYSKLMKSAVKHLQECYPGVPVLLMSIGDKGTKGIDGITTHSGVLPLVKTQREIAESTGICFWNTYDAMGGDNSMISFVNHKPPMAAKDYTHINIEGGNFIGERLFGALMLEQKRLVP